ncbi:hypothetical protein Mapa_002188 [Marchantia paleacea]|nr:hypothetical protein Mapa_002188 [Marchantia paleacea]
MPDYDPGRGSGPMRRTTASAAEVRPRQFGPGGLPTEGVDPAPRPWPWAPWMALIICVCFLGLQLYPATHFRHPRDPTRTWQRIPTDDDLADGDRGLTLDEVRRKWDAAFTGRDSSLSPPVPMGQTDRLSTGQVESTGELSSSHSDQAFKWRKEDRQIHVFISSDEMDLRPLAVVINSTLKNARHPGRIVFHLIIPTSENNIEYYKLKAFFPSASIDVFRGFFNFEYVSHLIRYRNDSFTREELTSPYNFVPYYLPQLYDNIEVMIYLDSDVVVKGDIEELYLKNLNGHPAAAVEDCSQQFKSYFDFEQLNAIQERGVANQWLPSEPFEEQTCIFNRGVLVINATRWSELNVTGKIEWWMEEYHKAEKPLYRYGLSQPPFLLALYKNYEKLEHAWNNRGLGRDKLSKLEQEYFAARYKHKPDQKPFLSLESDFAKILHFNGKYKPWKRGRTRLPMEEVISLCGEEGQECHKLWWEYLSPEAHKAFGLSSSRD